MTSPQQSTLPLLDVVPDHTAPTRVFLGWERPALPAIADWLIKNHPQAEEQDFSNSIIVLPSSRAGRRLIEILAQQLAGQPGAALFAPPRILTLSALARTLFTPTEDTFLPAPDFLLSLAWQEAFHKLDEKEKQLLAISTHSKNASVNTAVANSLASVCREIRAALLQPSNVVRHLSEQSNTSLRAQARWQALATAYKYYLQELDDWQYSDPTEFKITCFQKGNLRFGEQNHLKIIVAALPEFDTMYELALGRLPSPQILVHSPENSSAFDVWGRLNTKFWSQYKVALRHGEITVCSDSREQAQAIGKTLSKWKKKYPHVPSALCAPDAATFPELQTALEKKHLTARSPILLNYRETRPFELLSLFAKYTERRAHHQPPEFQIVARIARHPDFLAAASLDDVTQALDHLHENRQPFSFDPSAYTTVENSDEKAKQSQQIPKVLFVLEKALNSLFAAPPRGSGLKDFATHTRNFLNKLYAPIRISRHSIEGRTLVEPLQALLETLNDIESFAEKNSQTFSERSLNFSAFLKLLIESLANRNVPPPENPNSIPLIGWLEISGEDAPFLCIASLCEGLVPASVTHDIFLPGNLRKQLQINHDEARLAREVFLLAGTVACRQGSLRIFVPKQNTQGDPLRPSRVLLSGLKEKILASRLLHLLRPNFSQEKTNQDESSESSHSPLPLVSVPLRTSLSVTEFARYITSPRLYYYERALGLQLPQDSEEGLTPALTGTILHNVFESFGHDASIRESRDQSEIHKWLCEEFDRQWEERFAKQESSLLRIQKTSLEQRLYDFSRHQVQARKEGWEIVYTERSHSDEDQVQGPLCVLANGKYKGTQIDVHGRIDRVDHRPNAPQGEARWRIIDYKTGKKAEPPDKKHFKKTKTSIEWKELQLPLYHLLFPHFAKKQAWENYQPNEPVELCYFLLPEESSGSGISKPFDYNLIGRPVFPEDKNKALGLEKAVELAHKISNEEFEEIGKLNNFVDPIFKTLCGEYSQNSDDESEEELPDE
ncbi:MAG: PD-(D/E)XK nuclease family protein [Chthoniobacterales bacterium]